MDTVKAIIFHKLMPRRFPLSFRPSRALDWLLLPAAEPAPSSSLARCHPDRALSAGSGRAVSARVVEEAALAERRREEREVYCCFEGTLPETG